MRLKCAPDDFRVFEILDFAEDPDGPFFVHRLHKEKLDTLEALAIVARQARVPRADIAFAGLKDRQGVTEQWISIKGKRAEIRSTKLRCRFVGRSLQAISSKMSRGNDFSIVVRDLSRSAADRLVANAPLIERGGFANYFDDQRFDCLQHGQGFIMRSILEGRYDEALRRLVAVPSPVALGGDVKLKRLLKLHWGEWERCLSISRGPVYRSVFEHLVADPRDFRGALERMPSRIKLIHAFAYQSLLWNRAADRFVSRHLGPDQHVPVRTRAGTFSHWHGLDDRALEKLRAERTPLYGPDGDGGGPGFRRAMEHVLHGEGLTADSFRAHQVRGMVLRDEPRELVVVPRDLRVRGPRPDEQFPGQFKVLVEFGLPRGSYATHLIKRLVAEPRHRHARSPRGSADARRTTRRSDRGSPLSGADDA